jgi:hypothetical protein
MTSLNDTFPGYKKLFNAEQLLNDYKEDINDLKQIIREDELFDGLSYYKSKKTNYKYEYNAFTIYT